MTNAETRETRETFSREERRASGAQVGSSKETKDEETKKISGLGGVLAKAFGFDRRKNMPAVAAADETRETSVPNRTTTKTSVDPAERATRPSRRAAA